MKDDRLIEMRVFQSVVATGAFTAAAHSLGVSQPFVSQTVQRLEARLRTKLMNRTTRGHHLTPEGRRFLDVAQRVLDTVEAAEADWQLSDAQVEGLLRVSVPIAFGLDRITPLIPQFLDRHPNISLETRLTDDTENLIENQIDVAIRMGALRDSGLIHRRLCGLQRLVVATPELVARHGMPTRPADLADFPSIAWDGSREHLNRWKFLDGGKEVTVMADGRYRSNQGMSLYQLCLAGVGAMRMAEHLARPAIDDGRLVQLLPDHTAVDDTAIFAVFLPDRHIVPRIRKFVDFMVEAFRSPDWEAPETAG